MSDNNRNRRGVIGKGYYIALVLCAAAIGITGYLYAQSADKTAQTAIQETQSQEIFLDISEEEDIPVLATEPKTTLPPATQTVPPTTERQSLKTMSPVAGDAISGYSMEALSYNQTTRDWRVHNGIDLAAEEGSQVLAAADGEVYTVYEDDSMGHTVVIRHNDGYTTCYSSLSENILVKPGDEVSIGACIGYASDSAITESTIGSHVHFSVTHYDEPMDPEEFLSLGQ